MHRIGNISDLNHFAHAASIAACGAHHNWPRARRGTRAGRPAAPPDRPRRRAPAPRAAAAVRARRRSRGGRRSRRGSGRRRAPGSARPPGRAPPTGRSVPRPRARRRPPRGSQARRVTGPVLGLVEGHRRDRVGTPLPLKATALVIPGGTPPGSEPRRGQDLHAFTSSQTRHRAIRSHPVGRSSRPPLRASSPREDAALQGKCRRTSRVGSPGGNPPSGPCRAPSRTSFAAISSAASSASDSPAHGARAAARASSSRFRASAAASVRPATVAIWRRPPPTSSITSSRRYLCGGG